MTDSIKNPQILDQKPETLEPRNRTALFRVTGFLVVVLIVLAVGFGIGHFVDQGADARDIKDGHFKAIDSSSGDHAGHNVAKHNAKADVVGGLAASDKGYTLRPESTNLMACTRQMFWFRIIGPDGEPVRDYSTEQTERMRLAIIRHDFSGYQQVEPKFDSSSGVWSAPITLVNGGRWRILVDFVVQAQEKSKVPLELGIDITTDLVHALRTLPPPSKTRVVDGVTVDMNGELKAGEKTRLEFTSTDGGASTPLEPYLDAYGHLILFRQGDFGYIHGVPEEKQVDNKIAFSLTVPKPGTYVAYLHFKIAGSLHTAAFTLRVQ